MGNDPFHTNQRHAEGTPQEWGYYHSNAHEGRPCDEYSRQISRQLREMKSGAWLGWLEATQSLRQKQRSNSTEHS